MSETLSVASRLEHHDSVPTSAAPVDPCGGDVGGVRRRVSTYDASTTTPEWSASARRAPHSSVRGTAFT
jgi:hypothetical protein